MKIADFQKHPQQKLKGQMLDLPNVGNLNPLLKKINRVNYDLVLMFQETDFLLIVNGIVDFEVLVLDAIDGHEFLYTSKIDWDDTYSFASELTDQVNLVLGEEFNLQDYLIEQINMNLPINITEKHDIISKNGFGWEFLSESDYQQQKNSNSLDPRWEKLDDFKAKK